MSYEFSYKIAKQLRTERIKKSTTSHKIVSPRIIQVPVLFEGWNLKEYPGNVHFYYLCTVYITTSL
jgi:hypothetical protein